MQAKGDAVFSRELAHGIGAFVVERGNCVVRGIELDIDIAHMVFRRPLDAFLEPDAAAQIDADAFAQSQFLLLANLF